MGAAVRQLGYHAFDAWSVTRGTLGNPYRAQNLWAADYAPDLVKGFIKAGFADTCPITALAAQTSTPFDYLTALKEAAPNASARWQLRTLAFFNVGQAWIVPLNTLDQMRGVTLYMKGTAPEDAARFQASRYAGHLLATIFMDAFVRVNAPAEPEAPSEPATALSGREVDCLEWVARGKTNWEVSRILDISENTVRFHLKNAFRKLEAPSRSSAVMRAIQAKLIEP